MNIYLIMQDEEDYRNVISTPISAHPTRQQAEAEAARLDLDAAWASNQPLNDDDYEKGRITHYVYEIPYGVAPVIPKSTPVDIDNAYGVAPPPKSTPVDTVSMTIDHFAQLVRDGRVLTHNRYGDACGVQIDKILSEGVYLVWSYEDSAYDYYYHGVVVRQDAQINAVGSDSVEINGVTFTITQ